MSDLMIRILNDTTSVEEVVHWLLSSDMTVQKEGYTKTAFARYLLDFLRKRTQPLLPNAETSVPVIEASKSASFNTSTPVKTPSHESCQNLTSVSSVHTSFESRSTTPIHYSDTGSSRSRTTASSSCNSSTVSQNTSVSSPSRELLERRFTSKESSRNHSRSVQLEDYIVTKEKPKRRKRIKPTAVNKVQEITNGAPFKVNVKGDDDATVKKRITPTLCSRVSASPNNLNEPIKILKRVPFARVDQQTSPPETVTHQPVSSPQSISGAGVKTTELSCAGAEIKAPLNVSLIKEERKILIQKLALLYSSVITGNYSLDLLKELSYLMSLLSSSVKLENNQSCTSKIEDGVFSDDGCHTDLFLVNGEGVYFAATVLEHQWFLLKQLTDTTLRTLAQMFNSFFPKFAHRISSHIEQKKSDSQNVSIVDREMLSGTVKFKMDTDCRPNYVNDQLFCAFKKQRDDFYMLMQEWEDETSGRQTSADFFKAKVKKVKSILTTSTESTIMHRLADLFVSQILASTLNENKDNKEAPSVDGITPTKYNLLNKRIRAPSSAIKRFPGVQEFFKDFLRSSFAENSFFTAHVRDVLIQRIITLNSINISSETSVASVRQELYLVCVNKLCLLAKFLSLITFLPYQDKETLPPHLRIPLVDARKHTLPPVHLDSLLTDAIETGRILVTVPWIVEFMNGIDDTSIQLPCYKLILAKLQYLLYKIRLPSNDDSCDGNIYCIYTHDVENTIVNENGSANGASKEKTENRMNMSQLKVLASETTSDMKKRFVNECLQTIECSRILITLYVNSLFNSILVSTIINVEDLTTLLMSPVLISSEFYIDNAALYQCFPQLNELKSILDGRKKLSYKSMVGPKTEKTFCDHQTNEVALDMQLEMHFFDNTSHSVKSVVDMVAKQVSSHCIGAMRDKIIPELKTRLSEYMKTALLKATPMEEATDVMLAKFYNILRRALKEELSTVYQSVESALKGMLKPDVREDLRILNICIDVTCRKCIEITYNWVFYYISFDGMAEEVKKVAVEEVARMKKNDDRISKKSKNDLIKNDFDTLMMSKSETVAWTNPGPVYILHRFRHLTRIVIAYSNVNISHPYAYRLHSENGITVSDVVRLIKDTISCIEGRTDLQFITFRRIMLISLDLIAVLVFLRPDLVTIEVLQLFAKMWAYRKDCKLHLHFEQVLSSRNIAIYSKRTQLEQENVRKCLSTYLHFTLENKIMHASRLFRQVLKVLQQEWPLEELLQPILICVKDVLETCCPYKQKIISALESMTAIVGVD